MAENYELAYIDYKNGMKYKEIAEKYGVTLNTVKSWKTRKWNKDDDEKGVHTKKQSVHTKSKGAPIGNTNATGNKGNKNASPPKQNTNAMKHGFYSKVIPEELMELFDELEDGISTADMLWDQIKVQYMAIMRAQSIMFVTDKNEMIKELKKAKYDFIQTGEGEEKSIERVAIEEEYNFQFAWERHAQFLTAQSRAIGELRSLIDQFETTADKNDERLLKLKKMRLDIKKTKAEIAALNKSGGATQTIVNINDPWRGDDFE